MAKTEVTEDKTCSCNCDCNGNNQMTVINGFKFGFGFFLANLVGILIIGIIAWVFVIIARHYGLIF